MKSLIILLALLSLSACGIKGKPLPPIPEEPLATSELEKPEAVSQTTTVKPLKTLPAKKKNK